MKVPSPQERSTVHFIFWKSSLDGSLITTELIGISVDGGQEMVPRQQIVPSFHSRFADEVLRLVVGVAAVTENLRHPAGISSASRRFRFCHRTAQK